MLKDAKLDNVLAGSIMEFCARYQSLISLLEKYDKEKTFLNVVETGVLGKVFSVMASISDDLRRLREPLDDKNDVSLDNAKENNEEINLTSADLLNRFSSRKKDLPKIKNNKKDAFSLALERSFSDAPVQEAKEDVVENHKEPVFTDDRYDKDVAPQEEPDSQKVLNDLKKQWSEIDQIQSEEDSLAYPFGGWTDVKKYQK